MKYTIAILLLVAVAVSAQLHHGMGHGGRMIGHSGHLGGSRLVGGHVGSHGMHGGMMHHRGGRSILLAQPVAYSTGIVHTGLVGSHLGLVGAHHGLIGAHHGLIGAHHGLVGAHGLLI